MLGINSCSIETHTAPHWLVLMFKYWHTNNRVTFEVIFMFLFAILDISDARWFIPRMRPVCNGEITDQQARVCSGWIRKINNKEQNDVRVIKRGLGELHRNLAPDADSEWNRTLDAFGREPNKK